LEIPIITHRLDQLVDRARRDAQDIGVLDNGGQRLLGHPTRLKKVRKIAALAQFGDAQFDRSDPRLLALLWQIRFDGTGEEFLTVGTSPGRRPCEEVKDSLPDGRHARLGRRPADSFFSSRCFEAAGLEDGIGDHGHQGVSVQPGPGSAFKVVKAELLLELLMRLLTDPSGFDRGGEHLEARIGW
jgi:hypothetical protein